MDVSIQTESHCKSNEINVCVEVMIMLGYQLNIKPACETMHFFQFLIITCASDLRNIQYMNNSKYE